MLKFSRLEPEKLYRVKDKFTLPIQGEKIVGKDNLITVLCNSMTETTNFFFKPYIRFRGYKKYYIEKYVRFNLLNRKIYIVNDQKELYDNGFGLKHPEIALSRNPGSASNYNTIYELGQYMNIINTDERLANKTPQAKASLKFNLIIDRLKTISTEFPLHKKKYLYLPIDDNIDNPKDVSIWSRKDRMNNTLIGFIRMIETNWSTIKTNLPEWTFVFFNLNELFYINCKDMTDETYNTIKELFKKYRSKSGTIVDEQTDPHLEVSEDDIDKADDNKNITALNNKITDKVMNDVDESLKDIKLPDNEIISIKSKVKDTIIDKKEISAKNIIKDNNITINGEKLPIEKETDDLKKADNEIIQQDNNLKDINKVNETELKKESERVLKQEILNKISPNVSPQRLARLKEIQNNMESIQLDGRTIKDIKEEVNSEVIEPCEIKANVINKKLKNIKFNNFEKDYNKKLMDHDLVNILTKFSEMDRPLYLIKLDKEDTSTTMDKKYTYTAVYEDEKGRRHTLKFDYPKFVNNKFIHINNSDKLFINQVIPLPVTKVSPDEVQISSNYKKVFIRRFGKNVSPKSIKFNKLIPDIDSRILKIEYGNNLKLNSPYMTSIEYDDLSQKYNKFTLKNHGIEIFFNQKEIRDICDENNLSYTDINIPFAIKTIGKKKEVILLNGHTDKIIGEDLSPIDYINKYLDQDDPGFLTDFERVSSGKRLMYTRATIMAKKVPLVLLLGFLIGLEPLLNRLKLDYQFSETRPRTNGDLNKIIIEFKDGYLMYDSSKFSNSLILNGLIDIPTKEYDFLQFSGKDIYFNIFNKLYGRRNIGNAFENFNQEFIDPITEEVLEHCKLPTNFVDLIIYGNSLLENNAHDYDGNMTNFRIRSNELVNVHLYQILTTAYEAYRNTADNKNPQKFSVKQNELLNSIFDSQILEEYSTLNPIFEVDRMRATSYKGPGGCNIDRAFSAEKRAYNDTMLGVFAQSSPVSANIGVSRVLSLNPNIKSLRGYIEPGSLNKVDSLDETNMLSGAELLVPLTATHDDPQRVAMASTQSRHTISTVDSDVPLFGYGFDKVLAKTISDRFAFKAKSNGVVSEIDENLGYMIIKYDDIEPEVVDLTNRQALNTGSGFYINNKLTPNLKVGDKVSEGDVVASNKDFFEYNELTGDTIYKSGPLARVAVIHGSSVFEDSTIMTEQFAERMASYVTEKKDILLGKNSNVYSMVNIGDEIEVNDPLLIFDESYEDEYLNKMLEKMSEQEKDDIIESGKTHVSSKWNGKVIDIKIYYTVPKDELSESLQRLINSYEKNIKKRLKTFKDNGINVKDMVSLNDQASFTEPVNGKIEGIKMGDNQVLIKFFIQTLDKFAGGDKCTYATALKGINQTLIPKGKEPYLASDPSIKVDAFMSISGYYARMTNSFPISMALNATLIGAEKKIKDILKK